MEVRNLLSVTPTGKQWSHAFTLVGVFAGGDLLGFLKENDQFYAIATRTLTPTEVFDLQTALLAFPDEKWMDADKTDYQSSPFKGLTPTQAEAWIDANVTDLASAKVALKKVARAILYLVRRSDLNN
jgi:hypothetical protein